MTMNFLMAEPYYQSCLDDDATMVVVDRHLWPLSPLAMPTRSITMVGVVVLLLLGCAIIVFQEK